MAKAEEFELAMAEAGNSFGNGMESTPAPAQDGGLVASPFDAPAFPGVNLGGVRKRSVASVGGPEKRSAGPPEKRSVGQVTRMLFGAS